MPTILDKIVAKTQQDLDRLKETKGLDYFKKAAEAYSETRPSFYEYLSKPGLSLIAELKKASPSKGVIRSNFEPIELAKSFADLGASALSVLTEPHFFMGHPNYLSQVSSVVSIPLLRKDFIIEPIQIFQAKSLGASAVLLIRSILSDAQAQQLIDTAEQCQLDVLMEVHNTSELEACSVLNGLRIIGVNNRDLTDFSVDTKRVLELKSRINELFPDALIVAESGYFNCDDLNPLQEQSIDAVLIGEGLARSDSLISFWKNT